MQIPFYSVVTKCLSLWRTEESAPGQGRDFFFFFNEKQKNKITKQNATDNVLFVILISCVEV